MADSRIVKWFVQVEWEDGTIEKLSEDDLPEVVALEVGTYMQELEDFSNGGWDMGFEGENV